jgi:hypothetical protein
MVKSRIGVRAKLGFSCLANDNNFGVMTGEQIIRLSAPGNY